jgi:hypothetical protein
MKYGIATNHSHKYASKFTIGSVYILDNLNEELYIVKEGNCDAIRKDTITLISKEEYQIMRNAHNEVLKHIDMFSEDAREYFEGLYKLRNTLVEEEKYQREEYVGKWHIVLDKCWVTPVIRVLNSETGKEHYKLELLSNWESAQNRQWEQVVDMVKKWKPNL